MRISCTQRILILAAASFPRIVFAQPSPDLKLILDRLDRLEQENRDLVAEVRALRAEVAAKTAGAPAATEPAAPAVVSTGSQAASSQDLSAQDSGSAAAPLDERVAVLEQRTADLQQTKVEAAHRLPITLTGMVLFNAFLNGRSSGGFEFPFIAAPVPGASGSRATLSQSMLGFIYQGPRVFGNGLVNGEIHMDFWGGSSSSLGHLVRLRTATVSIDWKNQSITVGQDKPIVSPRDPTSLAQVAYPPLSDAGNLWYWSPQIRFEQRFSFGDNAGIRARIGVYQTAESSATTSALYPSASIAGARPAIEGRFEVWRKFGKNARIEIAPGFHSSQSHVNGYSVPSRLFTTDWLIQPASRLQWTGLFFTGQNAAGIGALAQGFSLFSPDRVSAVGTTGGWTQLSYAATSRLTFNVYGGLEGHASNYLLTGNISRNFEYAGNAIYRLGSNVLLGLEAAQIRTSYLGQSSHLVNHYDAALGYLF